MPQWSIRWKLTLWYGGVLALVLTLFGTVVYLTLRHQLLTRIDRGLQEELADVLSEIKRARDEKSLQQWLQRRFAGHEGFDFQVTRANGQRFFVNPRFESVHLPVAEDQGPSSRFRNVELSSERRWRVISALQSGPGEDLIVQVARSLKPFDHELAELLFTFLLVGPFTLIAVVGSGYFLARRALAPVDQITETAKQITAERLSHRIRVINPNDELGALAETLNSMIERLEQSFTEMQRFTADAAHELRTPLAVMRSEAEVTLQAPRSPEEHRQTLENLLEEINRLSHISDQLLFLCRQDAGLHPVVREEVCIEELIRDVTDNMQMVAQEKQIRLQVNGIQPGRIRSNAQHLRRVLYNLLDNAIKYTEPNGEVTVTSAVDPQGLTIEVEDTGIGIPPEQISRVFERFYRVSPSRSETEGTGLGLAICRSCIQVLQGSIRIESTVGNGTTVHITLPSSTTEPTGNHKYGKQPRIA